MTVAQNQTNRLHVSFALSIHWTHVCGYLGTSWPPSGYNMGMPWPLSGHIYMGMSWPPSGYVGKDLNFETKIQIGEDVKKALLRQMEIDVWWVSEWVSEERVCVRERLCRGLRRHCNVPLRNWKWTNIFEHEATPYEYTHVLTHTYSHTHSHTHARTRTYSHTHSHTHARTQVVTIQ